MSSDQETHQVYLMAAGTSNTETTVVVVWSKQRNH